jgi:hypothetical protein
MLLRYGVLSAFVTAAATAVCIATDVVAVQEVQLLLQVQLPVVEVSAAKPPRVCNGRALALRMPHMLAALAD